MLVQVVATTDGPTRAALLVAGALARGAPVSVLAPQIVPPGIDLTLPLSMPAVMGARFRAVAEEVGVGARIRVCLCRRFDEACRRLLWREAVVVVGGPIRRWWPSPEQRLAARPARRGFRVVFAECHVSDLSRLAVSAAIAILAFATPAVAQDVAPVRWDYIAFADVGYLADFNDPSNHLFRNRGTTPRVDELDLNMAGVAVRKNTSESSRWGVELTAQAGRDSETFGFSATAPNIGGAEWLRHLGPVNVSYLAPVGSGLSIQGGIFNSLIGYDSLYAKDNFSYTRPWGADYTPYLMLGVNAGYAFNARLSATFFVVNGYWHLAHANDVPSIGGQVAYKPTEHLNVKETVLSGPHQSNTALRFWRVFSDTIVEKKSDRATAAFEYQIGLETIDVAGAPRALWTSAQLPIHWTVGGHGP